MTCWPGSARGSPGEFRPAARTHACARRACLGGSLPVRQQIPSSPSHVQQGQLAHWASSAQSHSRLRGTQARRVTPLPGTMSEELIHAAWPCSHWELMPSFRKWRSSRAERWAQSSFVQQQISCTSPARGFSGSCRTLQGTWGLRRCLSRLDLPVNSEEKWGNKNKYN